MKNFGSYLEQLRKERGLSRLDFCGDESELSIRQLVRIEKGQSQPTIQSMTYIGKRLGVPSYTLLPDYQELPKRYKELKYLLLRVPVHGRGDIFDEKEQYFDEIYESFYENLPDEEKISIDTIQATIEVMRTTEVIYADSILDEYLEPVLQKEVWTQGELLIIRLYFVKTRFANLETSDKINDIFRLLPKQFPFIMHEELFILRDVLISGLNCFQDITACPNLEEVIDSLKLIMTTTQDFQKKPIILMLEWKYQLDRNNDFSVATQLYQSAKLFAEVVEDELLATRLEEEWKKDLKKYL
ncbi:TPA: XRE family transcriptional regulator [Streptococcus suis]